MSALSKPKLTSKPTEAKPVSAAALLGAATKKAGKTSSHLISKGEATEAAVKWIALSRQGEELERELGLLRDSLLTVLIPWHEDTCAGKGAHEATVEVPTEAGTLRISFQHRYGKLPLDHEEGLREVVKDDFERYFKRSVSVKVRKEVAEDPVHLEKMVLTLAEALGPENFAALFEVEQSWSPTKAFTETRCLLPPETRAALNLAGIKQIVAIAAK